MERTARQVQPKSIVAAADPLGPGASPLCWGYQQQQQLQGVTGQPLQQQVRDTLAGLAARIF